MLTFWLFDRFGVDPSEVFESPYLYPPRRLPSFYAGVLQAWRALGGFCDSSGVLTLTRRFRVLLANLLTFISWN